MKTKLAVVLLLLTSAPAAFGQGYSAYTTQRLSVDTLFVDIMINATATSFVPATSSFLLNYDPTAIGTPSKVVANDGPWSTASDPDYLTVRLNTGSGFAGLTIEFQGGTDDNGLLLTTESQRVGTIKFIILDHSQTAGLAWRSVGVATQVFRLTTPGSPAGSQTDITVSGTFFAPDPMPLPIQLAALSAELLPSSRVKISWRTLSETDNYGFEVQKSAAGPAHFTTIANSFIAGHGTTTEQHAYSFIDPDEPGAMYRLKQIDRDGKVSFSDPVAATSVTGVTDRPLPTSFELGQNYPNPFNPATMIEFAIPRESHVRLEVYSLLGQHVATLVDELRTIGYYSVRFDAANLASGVYLYRLQAGDFSFVKKLVVLK